MPEVRIQKLALKLSGLDPRSGERLAKAVTAAFERMPLAADLPQQQELVRFEVRTAAGASSKTIASQIMAALARELRKDG